jgi:hypothetical protein
MMNNLDSDQRNVSATAYEALSRRWTARALECNALRDTLREIERRLAWIERDRREPDKVLCAVQSARGLLIRAAFDEEERR